MSEQSWYLNQIGRVPLLTAAQEIELGNAVQAWLNHPDGPDHCPAAIRRRGKRAKDQMVKANLRLVVSIVQKRRASADEFMDLVQAGNLGLIRAVELFDPTRGYKFSTYSYWWIRQGIMRHLECCSRTIRLPTTEHERLSQIWKTTRALTQQLEREPSRVEIAAALDMPAERLNDILQRSQPCRSLDDLAIDDGSPLAELVAAEDQPLDCDDPLVEQLRQGISTLDKQAAEVIRQVWGIDGPPQKMSTIAAALGLNMRQVQLIRRQAENQLRLMAATPMALPVVAVSVDVGDQAELGIDVAETPVIKIKQQHKARRQCGDDVQLSLLPA